MAPAFDASILRWHCMCSKYVCVTERLTRKLLLVANSTKMSLCLRQFNYTATMMIVLRLLWLIGELNAGASTGQIGGKFVQLSAWITKSFKCQLSDYVWHWMEPLLANVQKVRFHCDFGALWLKRMLSNICVWLTLLPSVDAIITCYDRDWLSEWMKRCRRPFTNRR